MTFYAACVARNLLLDHHESDLYVLDTPEARALASEWGVAVTGFKGTDGKRWLDAAFAYEPFWQAKKEAVSR